MPSYTRTALLFALCASSLVSPLTIHHKRDEGEPIIELPDGELGDWAPGHTAINTLQGSAKASAASAIDTGKAVIQAPQASSILESATSAAAAVASSQAAAASSSVSTAAPSSSVSAAAPPPTTTPTPSLTPAPITHATLPSHALSSLLSSEKNEAATLTSATIAPSQIPISTPIISGAPIIATSSPQNDENINIPGAKMVIAIKNNWPHPLSISYLNNADSPSALGAPTPAPLGTSTVVAYPTGWAGRINIGSTTHSADTKIEGSTTGANDIDVSLVDGYSVPITCSVKGTPVTGCNIDLWSVSGPCADSVGDKAVCLNPMQGVADGPATNWFLPCQGAAYTFPNDNVANDGDTGGAVVECCVGTEAMGCQAPSRQGKGDNRASKREVGEVLEKRNETGGEGLVEGMSERAHAHLKRHVHSRRARGGLIARGLSNVM